jgi:hypothetical protein
MKIHINVEVKIYDSIAIKDFTWQLFDTSLTRTATSSLFSLSGHNNRDSNLTADPEFTAIHK